MYFIFFNIVSRCQVEFYKNASDKSERGRLKSLRKLEKTKFMIFQDSVKRLKRNILGVVTERSSHVVRKYSKFVFLSKTIFLLVLKPMIENCLEEEGLVYFFTNANLIFYKFRNRNK